MLNDRLAETERPLAGYRVGVTFNSSPHTIS